MLRFFLSRVGQTIAVLFSDRVEFGEGIVAHGSISPPMGGFYDSAFESGKNGQYYDPNRRRRG